jgi:hypothetical protein
MTGRIHGALGYVTPAESEEGWPCAAPYSLNSRLILSSFFSPDYSYPITDVPMSVLAAIARNSGLISKEL